VRAKVILDANVYCEANFGRSGKFDSLVDFVRKTNSQLVLLSSVLEEVLSKYERDFRQRREAAIGAVKTCREYSFTDKKLVLFPPNIDFSAEKEALLLHLSSPAKGISVELFEDYSALDILEVVRRGARRMPPANANGEELRDVINWLATLIYAGRTSERVLFVTRDKGFWTNDTGVLRPEIITDIKQTGREIVLFHDIDELLKNNSLSSAVLDATRAGQLFEITKLSTEITSKVVEALNRMTSSQAVIIAAKILESTFQKGRVYVISPASEYVKATYEVTLDSEMEFRKFDWWDSFQSLNGLLPTQTVSLAALRKPEMEPCTITALVDVSTRVINGQPGTPELEGVYEPQLKRAGSD
jgi:hypothetical protein